MSWNIQTVGVCVVCSSMERIPDSWCRKSLCRQTKRSPRIPLVLKRGDLLPAGIHYWKMGSTGLHNVMVTIEVQNR